MQQMEQPIGGVVKCLSNQIRRHLDAAASEAGLVELTGTQGMILHYLLRNEGRCLTQRDVEQRFQLRGATLSRPCRDTHGGRRPARAPRGLSRPALQAAASNRKSTRHACTVCYLSG